MNFSKLATPTVEQVRFSTIAIAIGLLALIIIFQLSN